MKRGGTASGIELGEKRTSSGTFGGSWSRPATVSLGRVKPRTFLVGVSRGNSVRIAYRGNQRGWEWHGFVRIPETGREVYGEKVGGSTGARGLLEYAGVYAGACVCGSTEDVRRTARRYDRPAGLCGPCRAAFYAKGEAYWQERRTNPRPGDDEHTRLEPCRECKGALVLRPSSYEVRNYRATTPLCGPCAERTAEAGWARVIALELAKATGTAPSRWTAAPAPLGRVAVSDSETGARLTARVFEAEETLMFFLPKTLPPSASPERVAVVWAALSEVALAEPTGVGA